MTPLAYPEPHLGAAIGRLSQVLLVVLRYSIAYLTFSAVCRIHCLQGLPWAARILKASPAERLRDMFQDLGGTFLKFGQMLALQPDILPLEYCNALFDLLDRVAPLPFAVVDSILVEDLGRPACELFESIAAAPIASASIGQVHAARIAGRKVAVKVQRPTARAQFTSDTRLMTFAVWLIQRTHLRRVYWLIEPMTEFVLWTTEELDYRCEARYMERLRRNAETNAHEYVPEVLWPYLSPRVLVTEFLEGETVLAYLRSRQSGGAMAGKSSDKFDPHALASNIIDNFLGDVFHHGVFHADLHPANLMILPDNVVGYIDFGITGTISRYSRQNLVAVTLAYTRGDLKAMCDAFLRVSTFDERSSIDRFRAGLEAASRDWYGSGPAGRRLRKNFTLVMLDMLRLSRQAGIYPERDVIKYIRSAIAIDGLITRLAPTFDVRRHLEQLCARYIAEDVRYSSIIFEAVAACAISGVMMLRTGGARAATVLQRLAAGDLPVRIAFDRPLRRAGPRRGIVAAGCFMALATSVLGLTTNSDASVAMAELSIVACLVAVIARAER